MILNITCGFVEHSSLANCGNNHVFFAVTNRRFSIVIIVDGKHVISFPSQTNCRRFLIFKKQTNFFIININHIDKL